MRFTFPSIAEPKLRYAIFESERDNKGYSWTSSSAVISGCLAIYDTLGDGETQHSQEYCPTNHFDRMTDFVHSLLPHVKRLDGEVLDNTHRMFIPYDLPKPAVMDFIRLKAVYDPDKYGVYVNVSECRKSTVESKRHDKRWIELTSTWDGSIDSVRRGLYEADMNRFVLPLQSITLDLHIAKHFDQYAWSVAHRYYKLGSSSIFSGATEESIEQFVACVETLGYYLASRVECKRLEASIDRMAQRTLQNAES